MVGDVKCLFWSLAVLLRNNEGQHAAVRQEKLLHSQLFTSS